MHRLAISDFHVFRGPLWLLWLLRPHPGRLPVSEGMSACFGVFVGVFVEMPVSMGVSARREARPTS